ncbi:MATE family efflux transporter [Velocimicrobium porci]|uniref:Probable multidrug resistance protein NorM n=1 Tax=Velocimicrobium porci TaxID=2606634 RepID=A0A6L5XVK8_9FIRM|nr:MATE family efflux transporter [Velocimicrobium porci]MSS62845.1 MATE family efflux transporter [Velocimicrobium porci]
MINKENYNKAILISILTLAWPTVLEQFLQTIVQYIDTAMVGQLGAKATAAVGISTTVNWLINSPLSAAGVGLTAYIAKSIGAKQYENAKKASVQSIFLTLSLGIFIGILTLGISPFLPNWLGAEASIQKEASTYFAIICLPMLFRASIILFGAVLRAAGDTKTPMRVNVTMNLINIILNYIFIYDTKTIKISSATFTIWGAGLGTTGAGLGTAISYVIGGLYMIIVWYRTPVISPAHQSIRINRHILHACVKVGFPVALERTFSCLGHVVFTSLVANLGTIAFAAHTIALTAEEAFYIPGYGMQAAAATLSGNAVGAGDNLKLKHITRTLLWLIVAIMAASGGLLFFNASFIMSIFTKDSDVIHLGTTVLKMVAISEPVFGIAVILEGIFNGVGDTLVPFFISLSCMWGIRILMTYLFIHFGNANLPTIWCCMIANNVCQGCIMFFRYKRGNWNPIGKK